MNTVERNNRQHELYRTSKRSAEKSGKIARELDHPYVGTEHLLLAFMRVCTGVAGQILSANGVEEANLYKIVDEADLTGRRSDFSGKAKEKSET